MPRDTGALNEAYVRLHHTGPEFQGWSSNHGPMVAEAMARRDHDREIGRWLDAYSERLEEYPGRFSPIGGDWQEALGDARRIADWTDYFQQSLAESPWREVLNLWWPRLLPGVAAAATHGVIRVGHAVMALQSDGEGEAGLAELAQALAYWAARWQPIPGAGPGEVAGSRGLPAQALADAIERVPRISEQTGGIRERLERLGRLEEWSEVTRIPMVPDVADAVPAWLEDLVDTTVCRYLRYGHGSGVMLVHSATAPNAILRSLVVLDRGLWVPSARAAWGAVTALTSIYAPLEPADPAELPAIGPASTPADIFARAIEHGDEHVIKFADTALDSYERTRSSESLAAAVRATELIEPF